MDIIRYKPSKLQGQALKRNLSAGLGNQSPNYVASIILPIPTSITAANGVTWNGGTMNPLEDIATRGLSDLMESGFRGAPQVFHQYMAEISSTLGDDVRKAGTSAIARQIIKSFGSNVSFGQVLARQSGQVLNPNMELLFDGPGLRTFSFNYQLAPRNEAESRMVKRILRRLKQSMSAKRTTNKVFICTPDIFQLRFKTGGSDHKFLNRFKQMALTNITVDYTGSGTYSSYEDGTPTIINMSMAFQELAPVYADDYDEKEGKIGVGY
jgi:hypothetical protein